MESLGLIMFAVLTVLLMVGFPVAFTLLAVPPFVFMGLMLERSGLAEDLLETMSLLFGRMSGGLAISAVIAGALLGASTGIVGATVVTMGLLSLPAMLRRCYRPELAAGTISASGTLGQIIPPDIVLVLLGDIAGFRSATFTSGPISPSWCWWCCIRFAFLLELSRD